jgi:hypothetical protein
VGKKILRGVGRVLSPVVGLAGSFAAPGLGGIGGMAGMSLLGGIGGMSMGGFGGRVKKQDEFTLSYDLVRLDSSDTATRQAVLHQSAVARARRDGEDVLTPLLRKAAEVVVSSAARGPVSATRDAATTARGVVAAAELH